MMNLNIPMLTASTSVEAVDAHSEFAVEKRYYPLIDEHRYFIYESTPYWWLKWKRKYRLIVHPLNNGQLISETQAVAVLKNYLANTMFSQGILSTILPYSRSEQAVLSLIKADEI